MNAFDRLNPIDGKVQPLQMSEVNVGDVPDDGRMIIRP